MILFLDFDGVLHEAVCRDEENLLCRLPLFEEVMREYRGVELVISSTWRDSRTLSQLQALFSADIRRRVIGVTPRWQDVQDANTAGAYIRQAEIEAWLKLAGRAWEEWVALDDKPYLFKPFLRQLIVCDPASGMTEKTAEQLRTRLQDNHPQSGYKNDR